MRGGARAAVCAVLMLFGGARAEAQVGTAAPAAPVLHAVRIAEAPTIDGVLDEPFWAGIAPVTDFRQREPVDGASASEPSEVRVAFTETALYFGLVLRDSDPANIRRSILHREGRIDQDDRVIIALDTYHDRRNAYIFELNPFGTQGDALISDESMAMSDWDWEGVYNSEGRITDEGWVLEVEIPFTTIRFSDDAVPEMGVAFYRSIRRKNEEVTWPHIGQEYRSGIFQVSRYATLQGLESLRRGRYMELKPYAIAGRQNLASSGTQTLSDFGGDLKYAITSSLALDVTVNPDFAQVEADNVQINLTRFSLFFPEKREFFLERQGLFQFGAARQTEAFFSRRIGLPNDIRGGSRVTGQVGPLSVGALALATGDARDPSGTLLPGGLNSVVRVRADVLPRTTAGAIFTTLESDGTHNRLGGADLQVRFAGSSSFDGWFSQVWDSGAGTSSAGAASLDLRSATASVGGSYTSVDADYDPALGFVQRRDMRRTSGSAAWFPRFESSRWARRLTMAVTGDYITGQDGDEQSTSVLSHNMLTFQSGDWVMFNLRRRTEILEEPARIQSRTLPIGDYVFTSADLSFRMNESRAWSGSGGVTVGQFWGGTRTEVSGGVTWKTGPHLTVGINSSHNRIDLPVPDGAFNTTLVGVDLLGALSRNLFANGLIQYDDVSHVLQANIRIDWIHTPGSDLFLVLDTGYRTGALQDPRQSRWDRRTGVVKLTYLKAF
ncbi:MAG: DUF5916 domain-containing protein [Gemmatimonadota bacterium]|nr:carbohydrate binding family 9 domain-containing protein [Gemmatimonadota bacterium]